MWVSTNDVTSGIETLTVHSGQPIQPCLSLERRCELLKRPLSEPSLLSRWRRRRTYLRALFRFQVSNVTDTDVLPVGLFALALLGPSTALESEHNLGLPGRAESSEVVLADSPSFLHLVITANDYNHGNNLLPVFSAKSHVLVN
jgi:hypothetical protein